MKLIAPLLAYLAVAIGMFQLHSAWAALLGFHLAIIFSLWWAKPTIPIAALFRSTNIKWIILSVLLCGSSGPGLYFLWENFGTTSDLAAQIETLGLTPASWPGFIAYFVLVNPLLEEYFWRGYLGSRANGLYIYDLIYAGFHTLLLIGKVPIYSIIFALTVLTFAGWLWRQIAREDRGLLAPVLGHMAADFTILLAVFWKV
ncbi:MAG TPA: CPBP family glutamic-type intramembrane protease [Anaerolineales bacterium]|nr:CPBP family glutamic-type intramembrane protease [Anaerolineales bacterium]